LPLPRRVPLPKVKREEMRFLTPAEVAALAEAIHPRYRALVLVGAYGGLRIGELAGLRRGRVDLLRGAVQVAEIVVEVRGALHMGPPKTRASRRTVGLPRFVAEELAAHLAGRDDPEAFVFTAPQGGPLRVTAFRARVWRPATRASGLDGLRIHDLRHTAVALWIAAGANPKEVAARAGHASVSFTLDRYGHLYSEADSALRDRLDVLYGTSRPTPRALSSGYAGLAAVAPVWSQAATGTTRAPPMVARRCSDLRVLGVEVRGFEPLASSVRGIFR
jgi:integrase